MATGLLLDTAFSRHDPGPGHPESPSRVEALIKRFAADGMADKTVPLTMRSAGDAELQLAHTKEYVALACREIAAGRAVLSTGDTSVGEASLEVARQAVGGLLGAVDAVMARKVNNAFCLVRPPGHHATADRGMGFCVFNSVAVAARHAQQVHGLKRIAIVDWDVHHGNGTQDIFYEDGSVFFFSTHQSPWYPGTGAVHETGSGAGKGTTLNRPLPAGSGMAEIERAFRRDFLPAMDHFRPELILISAGFDSRVGDPLGDFKLTDNDFAALTILTMDVAARHAEGRIVSSLEGGYNVSGLASAAAAHLQALFG